MLLPLCLIQGWILNEVISVAMKANALKEAGETMDDVFDGHPMMLYFVVFVICALTGFVLMSSLIYSLMKVYESREMRLQKLTFVELRPLFTRNVGRVSLMLLITIPLLVLLSAVCITLGKWISWWTLLATFPLLVAIEVPLFLFTPTYLNEDISLLAAFKKTFRLGFTTWGGVLLMAVVMALVGFVLYIVAYLPWQMAMTVNFFFATSEAGATGDVSVAYLIFLYLLAVVVYLVAYLGQVFGLVGMGYQYGHATRVVESITVTDEA